VSVPFVVRTTLPGATVAALLLAWACALPSEPTRPEPTSNTPDHTTDTGTSGSGPIFSGPPAPTPSPDPNPSPTATPTPPPGGEGAGSCGSPLPPDLSQVNVKVHHRGSNTWVLDSTPLVGPDVQYCALIGFTDSRSFCPVRPEGHPERVACELYVTGRALDTGRPGPTWYREGQFCTGQPSGCENHPENQYQLLVYQAGTYRACGKNGVCGEVLADK
jgi:hypothetical protein